MPSSFNPIVYGAVIVSCYSVDPAKMRLPCAVAYRPQAWTNRRLPYPLIVIPFPLLSTSVEGDGRRACEKLMIEVRLRKMASLELPGQICERAVF